jgi:hypothetical protein
LIDEFDGFNKVSTDLESVYLKGHIDASDSSFQDKNFDVFDTSIVVNEVEHRFSFKLPTNSHYLSDSLSRYLLIFQPPVSHSTNVRVGASTISNPHGSFESNTLYLEVKYMVYDRVNKEVLLIGRSLSVQNWTYHRGKGDWRNSFREVLEDVVDDISYLLDKSSP